MLDNFLIPAEALMDFPKVGVNLPQLPQLPKPAEELREAAAQAVGQVADQIASGASDAAVTFERVSESAFSALANVPILGAGGGNAKEGLEGTANQAEILGRYGEKSARALKSIASDP